jgi:hypothetical protein
MLIVVIKESVKEERKAVIRVNIKENLAFLSYFSF